MDVQVATSMAATSVMFRINRGVRRLSELNVLLCITICFAFMFYEQTAYLLDNIVQSVGHYIQWLPVMGFTCNTFSAAPVSALCHTNACFVSNAPMAEGSPGASRTVVNQLTVPSTACPSDAALSRKTTDCYLCNQRLRCLMQ
jgi:BCCT, betaine/carnitine/choline family transporter